MPKKNIFVMGDSYSTFEGSIPEGYPFYYNNLEYGAGLDWPTLSDVNKTWWKRLADDMDFNVVMNDSFSGSTVCNTCREEHPITSSFVSRIDKYKNEGFFKANKIDTFFIFGGTNDSWIDAPIGEIKYSDFTPEDLKAVLPAFAYVVEAIKKEDSEISIVAIINTDLKPIIRSGITEICKKYAVKCVELQEINKKAGHPTELGMQQICNQVKDVLTKK